LTIQCTDIKACGSYYPDDVTLKGFSDSGTPTAISAPAGYNPMGGGQNNSAVGSGGGCDSNGTPGAVCWDTSLPMTTRLATTLYTFSVSIKHGMVGGPLHVQATGYNNSCGAQKGGGKGFAVSNDLSFLVGHSRAGTWYLHAVNRRIVCRRFAGPQGPAGVIGSTQNLSDIQDPAACTGAGSSSLRGQLSG
jgi:hypothetical protein